MRRRDLLGVLGSAVLAWPPAARGQQVGKVPRIGYLSPGSGSPGPSTDLRMGSLIGWLRLRRSWSSSMLTSLFRW